jgi:Na+/H+ antiporter NhaD/arsenite permease-like protein
MIAAILIFAATYAVVAAGRVPWVRIDRAGAAFLGAALMVATGVLTLDEAWRAIDPDTILLLLGVMIVVANLRLCGFFRLVAAAAVGRAGHALLLLVAVVGVTGLLSAFLVNDTICLVLTPLVMDVVLHLRRNPVPYLIGVALAANVGSTATLTGNPQNIIIAGLSRISYGAFAASLAPVAAIGLVLTVAVLLARWPGEFRHGGTLRAHPPRVRIHRGLLVKTLLVTAGLVIAFFAGVRPAEAAVVAAALLLPSRSVNVRKMYAEIDWELLLMFAGLFVVVAGLERAVLTPDTVRRLAGLHLDALPVLSVVTALLSNLVSNVPAVLLLKPFVPALPDPARAWTAVAMASTLAGNFSILGSVANLIVVQRARRRGIEIGFWTYFSVGAPLTVATIGLGVAML